MLKWSKIKVNLALIALSYAFQVVHGISAYESDVVTLREFQMRARTHHCATNGWKECGGMCLLEVQELLNPDGELDLFILHTVFLRVINHYLNVFVNAWNHHPLRTERNMSPRKIWINVMIDPERRDQTAVKDAIDGFIPQNIEEFGVDNGSPFPDEQFNTVDVPETVCPIPDATMELFVQGDSVNIEDAVKEYTAKRLWLISYISNESVIMQLSEFILKVIKKIAF